MEGLIGLQQNINTTEGANRDLAILGQMDQRIQQDKDREVVAQQQEQLMYERAYAMADTLLEKDRLRINNRIKTAQKQVTDHLRNSGGSRKHFMEQGGLSVLGGITNDIMRSDEAITYQENRKNLAKIWEIQEKGLGHLLTPTDLQSAEDYDKNPNGGKITYKGMMAEIEIPPSANFDYGTDIPMEKIMSNESNAIKIRSNYALTYPDRPEPTWEELVVFAKKMNYGGTGSNTMKMQLAYREAMARAKYDAQNTASKKVIENSWISNYQTLHTKLPPEITIDKLEGEWKEKGMIESLKQDDPQFAKMLRNKNTLTSTKRALDEEGFDITDITPGLGRKIWAKAFNENYGLRESYEFMPLQSGKIVNRIFGKNEDGSGQGYTIENNIIKDFSPDEKMFRMDGVLMAGDNKPNRESNKGNYINEGIYTAFKGTDTEGNATLIMNAYNDDNKTLDEQQTKDNIAGYRGQNGGDNLAMTTVIALRNEKTKDLYYKEIDLTDHDTARAIQNSVGDDDNVQPLVDQDNLAQQRIGMLQAMSAEQEAMALETDKVLENKVYTSPAFSAEGEQYYGSNSAGQQNRYEMMKGFYSAVDYVSNQYQGKEGINPETVKKAIDKQYFSELMSPYAGNIQEDLKSYKQGVSNEVLINKWLTNINNNTTTEQGKQANADLANIWLNMIKLQQK